MDVWRGWTAALIVVDTSAVIAILFDEPENLEFVRRILAEPEVICPACVYVEVALKIERNVERAYGTALDAFFPELAITIVDFTREHALAARAAFVAYGRGRHALNFGDCMVYAVAKLADAPLLCKGEEFARTDIRPAL